MALSDQNNWRLLSEGSSTGVHNMALDYALTQTGGAGNILRLYGWNPRAISIGFHQSPSIVNLDRCKSEGIDLVRRPTGGRAILHDNEITYSLIMRSREFDFEEVYSKIHYAIAAAILNLGIEVNLVNTKPSKGDLNPGSGKSTCFTSAAKTELEYKGKKIVGSAGRQYKDALLIHGSILLGNEHKEIVKYLNLSINKQKYVKSGLDSKTSDLSTILGNRVDPAELVENLIKSFSKIFESKFKEYILSEETVGKVQEYYPKFDLSNDSYKSEAA